MNWKQSLLLQFFFLSPAYAIAIHWWGWWGIGLVMYVDIASAGLEIYKR